MDDDIRASDVFLLLFRLLKLSSRCTVPRAPSRLATYVNENPSSEEPSSGSLLVALFSFCRRSGLYLDPWDECRSASALLLRLKLSPR